MAADEAQAFGRGMGAGAHCICFRNRVAEQARKMGIPEGTMLAGATGSIGPSESSQPKPWQPQNGADCFRD